MSSGLIVLLLSIATIALCIVTPTAHTHNNYNHGNFQCGVNEQFNECGNKCNEGCASRKIVEQCDNSCSKGCFCQHGCSRNINGVCVPKNQCPQKYVQNPTVQPTTVVVQTSCGPKEEYKCSNNCMETCPSLRNCKNCPQQCSNGCYCKANFSRNANGRCIKSFKCPTSG